VPGVRRSVQTGHQVLRRLRPAGLATTASASWAATAADRATIATRWAARGLRRNLLALRRSAQTGGQILRGLRRIGGDYTDELQRLMKLRQAELAHEVQAEQARLARVTARLRQIEHEGHQPRYEVIVKRIEPRLVASIHDTIADHNDIGCLSAELRSYLKHCGITSGPLSPYLAASKDPKSRSRHTARRAAAGQYTGGGA
jgi:hypothetical protein